MGSQGDALRRTPQSAKYPHRSKNAGEGEFLCEAKKEGEPSSGVLLYLWLVCALSHHNFNRHSFAFSFDTRGAKEKASQKENAVFLCRFLKKAPQKLFLIALCKMYIAPDGFGRAIYVRCTKLYPSS